MKTTRIVILALLAMLLPLSGYSRTKHATRLEGPYSVGGKHAKHNTYSYLGKRKQHKPSFFRSPVSGQMVPGKPVHK
jgi:hypothetical protein